MDGSFCDAYVSWQTGGVETANGWTRRWLSLGADLGEIRDLEFQVIAMTINLTPRNCRGHKCRVEAFLSELGRDVGIRFAWCVALRGGFHR